MVPFRLVSAGDMDILIQQLGKRKITRIYAYRIYWNLPQYSIYAVIKGVGKVFTVTLVDDLIRYKRTFIFARQSGRIRWEESKF